MATQDTAVTSNGGSVYARLLCSFGCGSVMVYDMEAKATQNHIPRQPLVPVGIGRHHRAARLICLPPHFTLAVGSPFHYRCTLALPSASASYAAAPTRGSRLFYLHPPANTVDTFSKGSARKAAQKRESVRVLFRGNAGWSAEQRATLCEE